MARISLLVATALFVASSLALATCPPVVIMIDDYTWEPAAPVSFCIAPNRAPLAFAAGGQSIEATLRCFVEIWPDWEDPTSVPVEWWFTDDVALCDNPTQWVGRSEDGWITLVPAWRGGGSHGPGDPGDLVLWIPACPNQMIELGAMINFNSPDITGDGRVDLGDLALFSTDYHNAYHYRSDFNWNGQIDLGDVTIFAQAIGAECPSN